MNHMTRILALLFGGMLALPALAGTPVDVNKADAATLADSLDGIGLAKAQAIVAWRAEHGPFKSADDLTAVKGIGPAMVEKNRDFIQFDPAPPRKKIQPKAATSEP
jgi:competence protein ComEA